MASLTMIDKLEAEIWDARESARRFLDDCESSLEHDLSLLPPELKLKARQVSESFHTPLVRLSSQIRKSPIRT